MDGVTALAQHIKNRDNPSPYTPMFGKIISLPQLKIQLGSRILLDADDVKATFDIYEKIHHDGYTEYVAGIIRRLLPDNKGKLLCWEL